MHARDALRECDPETADAVRRSYADGSEYEDVVGLLALTETRDVGSTLQQWGYVVTRDDNEAQVFVTRTDRLEDLSGTQATMVCDVVRDVLPDEIEADDESTEVTVDA